MFHARTKRRLVSAIKAAAGESLGADATLHDKVMAMLFCLSAALPETRLIFGDDIFVSWSSVLASNAAVVDEMIEQAAALSAWRFSAYAAAK